jgi:hypothetical protein
LVLLVTKENRVQRECLDHEVSPENLVNQERQVLKETRDLPAHLVQMVILVILDHLDLQDLKDLLDQTEILYVGSSAHTCTCVVIV